MISSREHKYEIKTDKIDLSISYRPSKEWTGSGGYPSYKSITAREHLIQNSIWNGLVSKSEQLEGAGYEGALGIILCDGGSEYLRRSRTIIHEFFRTHPGSILFWHLKRYRTSGLAVLIK
jgi:hypothetical protein